MGYTLPASFAVTSILASCGGDSEDTDGIPSEKKFKDYKVVVVGAGAAGLYAGWYLQGRGFDVTILEAANRIGGRIKSHAGFADYDIELGAETLYGANTPWHDIVQASGNDFVNSIGDDYYFFQQDPLNQAEPKLKSSAQAGQYNDFLETMDFIDGAKNYSGDDVSFETSFATTGLWNMFGVANGLVGNRYGANNVRVSIKGYGEENALRTADSTNLRLKDATLLSVLESKFDSVLDKVETGKQVKQIDYSGETILVTAQNGQTYEADRVVLTVPIKILQDGDITFTPSLPSTKNDALQKIGMGAGMKVHLKFSNPFWENMVDANMGTIFGHNFLPEIYVSSRDRGSDAVLTALIMGERAEQFAAMGNDAIPTILSHLDDLFAVANIASQSWVQGASHIVNWANEPFIRGAYSFPIVGGGLVFRKELAAPVNDKLFFAGEATHSEGHSGTVHGAVETGIRVVEEVEASIA